MSKQPSSTKKNIRPTDTRAGSGAERSIRTQWLMLMAGLSRRSQEVIDNEKKIARTKAETLRKARRLALKALEAEMLARSKQSQKSDITTEEGVANTFSGNRKQRKAARRLRKSIHKHLINSLGVPSENAGNSTGSDLSLSIMNEFDTQLPRGRTSIVKLGEQRRIVDVDSKELASIANDAWNEAAKEALAGGRAILGSDKGELYRLYPDGRRESLGLTQALKDLNTPK